MTLQKIYTKDAPNPVGPYSQAIACDGLLYVSGQLGLDPNTGKIVTGGISNEAEQVCKNIQAILAAGGSNLDHVIKTTAFLQHLTDFADFNAVYEKYFSSHKPARSTFEVGKLPLGGLVEIELIAKIQQ